MITPLTRHQKNVLISCAIIMLVLGSAIMATGFVFEFYRVYDKIIDAKPANIHHIMFPHSQYWLGLPLFLLAFYVMISSFYSSTILHIIGLILCCFPMVAALCALGLQSATWYISLDLAKTVYSLQCEDVYSDDDYGSNPRCSCKREIHYSDTSSMDEHETLLSLMTCSELKRFPAIVSALVILSAFAFLACQATCFVYVKILRWLEPVHYEDGNNFHETGQHVLLNDNEQSM